MIDKDIKEMFYKKNKEIIVNKLLLDLDNNIRSLIATMDNIIYLEFAIYKEKMLNIEGVNIKSVSKCLKKYEQYLKEKIKTIVFIKKEDCSIYLKDNLFDDDISEYKKVLIDSTKLVEDNLVNKNNEFLENKIKNNIDSSWYELNQEKIDYFFDQKLTKDIFDKLFLQLKDRDTIIYNNALESYNKYLNLNNNIK